MKQLTITEVLDAFADDPISIEDRLILLGFDKDETKKIFSKELLEAKVYGSSFLVFLRENLTKLHHERGVYPEPIPDNFEDAFDQVPKTVGTRLIQSGFSKKDLASLFEDDTLNLVVNADEFTKFIEDNGEKLLSKMNDLIEKGGANAGV